MLQAIRDRATGWIAWAIVILISLTFAFWGIGEYFTPDPNVPVAKVNGSEIGYQRFQQAYARQQARLRSLLGGAYSPDLLDEEMLRRQTLETLVRDELVVQAGAEDGMRIGDAQLAGAIQSQQSFQDAGRFSQARYTSWLVSQGYSPGGFEFDLRRSMLTEQLVTGIGGSEIVTAREEETIARLEGQKRTIATIEIDASAGDEPEVSEDDARTYFDANRDAFMSGETLAIDYVLLSRGAVASEIEVADDVLQALYETRKDTLGTPEQREASHILVTVAADAEPGAVDEARGKAEELRARIEAGESFADLAREHSDDPGSAAQGGALGGFSRGVMDPAFEEAAFALEVDVLSEPVRSAFGFHLIKVTAIRPGGAKPFDELRDQLAEEYRREQAEQIFFERMERLANLTFENPDSLAPAADGLGLEVQRAGPGTRDSADTLLGEPAVWEAALVPEVLEDGANSELVELDADRVAVIRVVEHVVASPEDFDQARERIESVLRAERQASAALERGEDILGQLRGGAAPGDVAAEAGVEWSSDVEIGRLDGQHDPAVIETAFRAARPAADAIAFDGVALSDGSYVVIAVKSIVDPEPGTISDELRRAAGATLAADLGQRSYDAVVEALRDQAEVELRTAELDAQ